MMQRAAIFSAVLHIVIVIISITGLPFMNFKNELPIPAPIAVDILPIAAETQAPKPKPLPAKEEPKEEPLPPKPAPPSTLEPEPTPIPTPEPEVKSEPETEARPEPNPEAVPLPQTKPELKPQPMELPPTPPVKPKLKDSKPTKDKKLDKSFDSILKNIAKLKPATQVEEKVDKSTDIQSSQQTGKVGPEMTMSEMDALRQQIKGCWAINPGAKDIENFLVTVKILVNPDRTVREAKIVPNPALAQNGFYQAFAESTMRAVLNPRCSPLRLPEGKYEQWKELEMNFTPLDLIR